EVAIDREGLRIGVDGDLAGLASTLPAPLAKAAGSARAARFDLAPLAGTDAATRVRLRIAGEAGGAGRPTTASPGSGTEAGIELLAETGGGGVARRIALGVGVAPDLPDAGFALRLRLPGLDLDRWRELLAQDRDPLVDPHDLPQPDRVSLRVGAARIGGKAIEDLEVEATRADTAWQARVHARQGGGRLEWREEQGSEPAGTLVARFSRLEIPEGDKRDFGSLLAEAPPTLPALDVRADRFRLGAMDLGSLELAARQGGAGRPGDWLIDRLVLEHAAGRLEATGRWSAAATATTAATAGNSAATANTAAAGNTGNTGAARGMALDFTLAVGDAGRLLGAL